MSWALFLAWRYYRQARRERQELKLLRYIFKLHERQAREGEAISHFWLGSMYVRYGTSEQLEWWYRVNAGPVGGDRERLAELEARYG